ncbi:MAG: DUF2167 domain-containing protein [Candidatus Competibacter sp.]|nr:DUF2167 domain-containing protein [Candidatus Competibacter sp.]
MLALRQSLVLVLAALLLATTVTVHAQGDQLAALRWQRGPTTGTIGNKATIQVPNGYVFLDNVDTKKLMVIMENIPGDNQYVFAPSDLRWFAVFAFSAVGYVKDDETLNPGSLLETVTRGTEQGNVERRKRGWTTMTILGWKFQPRYDKQTNLLEWAFLAKEDRTNTQVVNYNTRLLGRTGVMEVVLVAEPDILDSSVADFKRMISGYSFVLGERYAEYRKGDRVAEFGLAALIAGGAAAVATKKGVWAAIGGFLVAAWKFVAAGVIGILAWIGSLFKKKA